MLPSASSLSLEIVAKLHLQPNCSVIRRDLLSQIICEMDAFNACFLTRSSVMSSQDPSSQFRVGLPSTSESTVSQYACQRRTTLDNPNKIFTVKRRKMRDKATEKMSSCDNCTLIHLWLLQPTFHHFLSERLASTHAHRQTHTHTRKLFFLLTLSHTHGRTQVRTHTHKHTH